MEPEEGEQGQADDAGAAALELNHSPAARFEDGHLRQASSAPCRTVISTSRTAEAARSISELTNDQSDKSKQAAQTMQIMADIVASSVNAISQINGAAENLQARAGELE